MRRSITSYFEVISCESCNDGVEYPVHGSIHGSFFVFAALGYDAGPIPTVLGALTNLTELYLGRNQFSGESVVCLFVTPTRQR